MFKPLTQLNYFFRLATERELSGSDQLMYLHIFNKFNAAHWTETLRIKDAELKELMRLYDTSGKPASIEVVRRGRQRLKAKGFLKYASGDGQAPEYKLPCLYPADTPDNTPADTLAVPNMRARIDVKTLDVTSSLSTARACEETELDNVLEHWERSGGGRLTFEAISELERLMREHGRETLKSLISEAADSNGNRYGLSIKFFRAVVERKLKGGERREQSRDAVGRNNPLGREYNKPRDFDLATVFDE